MKMNFFLFLALLLGPFAGLYSQGQGSGNYREWVQENGIKYKVAIAREIAENDTAVSKSEVFSISTYREDGKLLVYQDYWNSSPSRKEISEYGSDGSRTLVRTYDQWGDLVNVTDFKYDTIGKTSIKTTTNPISKKKSVYWYHFDSLERVLEVRFTGFTAENNYRMVYNYPSATETIWKYYNAKDSLTSNSHEEVDSSDYIKKTWVTENGNRYLSSEIIFDSLGNIIEDVYGFGKPIGDDFREKMHWKKYAYNEDGIPTRVYEYLPGKKSKVFDYYYYKMLPAHLIPPGK